MTEPISVSRHGEVVVCSVTDDVDIANTEALGAAILAAVSNDAIGVVIDLTHVRYLDSAGVRMLFMVIRELDACRQRTAISIEEDSPLRKLLKITNVDEVAYVCSALDDCYRALDEGLTGGL